LRIADFLGDRDTVRVARTYARHHPAGGRKARKAPSSNLVDAGAFDKPVLKLIEQRKPAASTEPTSKERLR
jgi:hypothetical protein